MRRHLFTLPRRTGFSSALKEYEHRHREASFSVWGTGNNDHHQIYGGEGEGSKWTCSRPRPIAGLKEDDKFIQISTCRTHSLAVSREGALWVWGSSKWPGVVMAGAGRDKPNVVEGLGSLHVKQAVAGTEHNIILAENVDGNILVLGTGSHEFGQCGIGGRTGEGAGVTFPHTVGKFQSTEYPVVQIAVGFEHSMALTGDGKVFTWGNGVEGQLGNGSGDCVSIPQEIEGLPEIRYIAAGVDTSAAISRNGEVFMWGSNEHGQIGTGSGTMIEPLPREIRGALVGQRIRSIHLGGMHTLAIADDYAVYGWGSNTAGKLGLNDAQEYHRPELVPSLSSKRIVNMDCSLYHTACVSEMGVAFTLGDGALGKLGHGDDDAEYYPRAIDEFRKFKVRSVACGMDHTLFLVEKAVGPSR